MIKADPKMGIPNDFSIQIIDIVDDETSAAVLFLAINQLPKAVKNISFEYTFGTDSGEYIWKDEEVTLSESEIGIIKPYHVVPYTLAITPEQEEIFFMTLEQDNTVMDIKNFDYELIE